MLLPREDRIIGRERVLESLAILKSKLIELKLQKTLDVFDKIIDNSENEILIDGLEAISLFNSKKVIYADSEGNLNSEDVRMAYFYHNRLTGYNLEQYI